jgi:hypothetical protein
VECASLTNRAVHPDRSTMQLDELLNQRQADATAFHAPPASALYPVEAFEEVRQFMFGNARSGVRYLQLDVWTGESQRHTNTARQGEFERIGD